MSHQKHVHIYTDGGAIGNPGPGGYGVIASYQGHRRELSGGFRHTTNNRMEIMAAITGLHALKEPCTVTVYTDSQYLADAINKGWARKWQKNGWMRNRKEPALNPDLWQQVLDLCEIHQVTFEWVRGHAGHAENERCHQLVQQACAQPNLPSDTVYEQRTSS